MDKKKYLKREALSILIILLLIIAGISIYKIVTSEKSNLPEWDSSEFGDIVVTEEDADKEKIPDNITDAYGLEYEYIKIPSVGIYTYKPVQWEILYEDDFFYFLSPEGDDKYPHMEAAICTVSINNIENTYDRTFAQRYIQKNIENHNTQTLEAMLFLDNQYQRIENGGETFGYYCAPNIEFTVPDQPEKGGWNPYSVIYMLNIDYDTATFLCFTGPKNYTMELDEVAKTMAYNTGKYENTDFDFSDFLKTRMKKTKEGNISYLTRDKEFDSGNKLGRSVMTFAYGDETQYMLSDDITSLAFNCKFYAGMDYLESGIDKYDLNGFMETMFLKTSSCYMDGREKFADGRLENPKYIIDSIEKINIANKDARKITWRAEMPSDSTGREYVDSIMPKMFTSCLVPDEDTVYIFTISYTKYQKYAALSLFEKITQSIGL